MTAAQSALEQGDIDTAEARLLVAAQRPESRSLARRALANLLLGTNQLSALAALLQDIPAETVVSDPLLARRRVEMLILRGRLDDARTAADATLAAAGESGQLHWLQALIAAERAAWPDAIAHSERALQLVPSQRDAAFLHLRALIENAERSRAADFCRHALDGEVPEGAYLALCVVLTPSDFAHEDEQKRLAAAAIDDPAFPVSTASLQGLVQLYWQSTGEAIGLLGRGHEQDADSLLGRYLLITRLLQLDRLAEARALALGIPGGYLALDPFVRLSGLALVAAGDWPGGYRRLERWTRKHPDDEQALRARLQAALGLGERKLVKAADAALSDLRRNPGDLPSAMDRVLKLPGGLAELHLARLLTLDWERRHAGVLLEKRPLPPERATTALLAASRLARQDPAAPPAELFLIQERLRRDPHDAAAERDLAALAARLPAISPVVSMTRARLAIAAGQPEVAARILRKLIERRPDDRPAGLLLDELPRPPEHGGAD